MLMDILFSLMPVYNYYGKYTFGLIWNGCINYLIWYYSMMGQGSKEISSSSNITYCDLLSGYLNTMVGGHLYDLH